MAVPVNIFLKQGAVPLEGVEVHLFDPAQNLLFVAAATSDVDGKAAFLVTGDVSPGKMYEVRFFKLRTMFPNPRSIEVLEPVSAPATNDFDVAGFVVGDFGVPADPRLCRCVGRLFNFSRQPVRDAVVRILANANLVVKIPKVVDGALISAESMETRTDAAGFFYFDLLRTGEYFIAFSGEMDKLWNLKVPDSPSCNITELIHPQPLSLTWGATGGNVSLVVGDSVEIPLSVLFSDEVVRADEVSDWIDFTNSDTALLDVVLAASNLLRVTAKAAGVATITPTVRPDLFPNRLPVYGLSNTPPLTVTVSP